MNPDLVFLVKQDNRTSERGFLIDIRAVDAALPGSSVAILGLDYSVSTVFGERDVLLQFDTNEDRLPVPFEVILDFSSLGPEAFQLQSANNANGPVFSPPNGVTVFSSTFVLIASQGGKSRSNIANVYIYLHVYHQMWWLDLRALIILSMKLTDLWRSVLL